MSRTQPRTLLLLVMVQVYLLLTLAPSSLPLSLLHCYLTMCYMCLPCLKTSSRFLPFVPITLLISYFLTLSFRCRIVTRDHCGSRWCLLLAEFRLHSVFCFGLSFSVRSSISTISMWHNCLGYPSLPLFHNFLSVVSISFPKEHLCSLSCNSGNINKSHKLHFSKSSITSASSLDVIFSDVWTSPFSFYDGFHYYVVYVYHYTKYIWLDSLCRKSDVQSTFVAFKQPVENYFSTTIKALYTDNGGEFLALQSFLTTYGITYLTTPPHTPEHNGYSERWHPITVTMSRPVSNGIREGQKLVNNVVFPFLDLGGRKSISLEDAQ